MIMIPTMPIAIAKSPPRDSYLPFIEGKSPPISFMYAPSSPKDYLFQDPKMEECSFIPPIEFEGKTVIFTFHHHPALYFDRKFIYSISSLLERVSIPTNLNQEMLDKIATIANYLNPNQEEKCEYLSHSAKQIDAGISFFVKKEKNLCQVTIPSLKNTQNILYEEMNQMETLIQILTVEMKQILLYFDKSHQPTIFIEGKSYSTLFPILQVMPELYKKNYFDQLAQIANFLAKGLEFKYIEDIETFKKNYSRTIQSEKLTPDEWHDQSQLKYYGLYDLSSLHAPSMINSELVFFVKHDYLSIPYQVTLHLPIKNEELQMAYELLPQIA